MSETTAKTPAKAHDTAKVEESRRHPEPAQGGFGVFAGDTLLLDALLGSSVADPRMDSHAALLSDPRFSHSANAEQKAQIVSGLQSRYGNAYVQCLLETRPVRTKLTVNPPDDRYERQADRPDETVTKSPPVEREARAEEAQQSFQAKPRWQTDPRQEDGKNGFQTKATVGAVPEVTQKLAERAYAARGNCETQPDSMRSSLDLDVGRDISDVKVHGDAEADDLSRSMGVKALTIGRSILFRSGDYRPHSEQDERLVAHELTHVIQQTQGLPRRVSRARGLAVGPIQCQAAVPEASQGPSMPRYEYELSYAFLTTDRCEIKVTFKVSRAKPAAVNPPGEVGILQLGLELKKKKGEKAALVLKEALATANWELAELAPGIKIMVDTTVLEAEIEKGATDVNIFKLKVKVEGNVTEAIAATGWGKRLLATDLGREVKEGASINVSGEIEVAVDPSDAVRLARAARLNRLIASNTRELAKSKGLADQLGRENAKIRKQLKNRKLSKPARKKLQARLAKNSSKVASLQRKILENKMATRKLLPMLRESIEGLKTKAGRKVGQVIAKIGGRTLAKFIPVVGQVLTVLDFCDTVNAFIDLATGEAEIGPGGGGEHKGGQGGKEGEQGEGGKPGKEGERPGSESEGGEAETLGEEIDVGESLEFVPASGLAGPGGKEPNLHPAASAVWEAIKASQGIRFTRDDMAQLNDIVPADLKSGQLETILDALNKSREGKPAESAFDVLGSIQSLVNQLRSTEPVKTLSSENEAEGLEARVPQKDLASSGKQVTKEEIKAFIDRAKEMMAKGKVLEILVLDQGVRIEDLRKGTVLRGMMALRVRDRDAVFAGRAEIVLVRKLPGDSWECHRLSTDLYDEKGNLAGTALSRKDTYSPM